MKRPWIRFNPTQRISTIEQHRTIIEGYSCPKCSNRNLKVVELEEGGKGWEAKIHCARCSSSMTLNNTGFNVKFADGKK